MEGSRDVQLLLWAVGEARDRRRRRPGSAHTADRRPDPAGAGAEFFTEWQAPKLHLPGEPGPAGSRQHPPA